jgi:hypothetical protein
LANCPAIRPTLITGTPDGVREGDRHLQDDFQLVTNRVRRAVVERLRAVTGLEEESIAVRHVGEIRLKAACFAREDQRRFARELGFDARKMLEVGPRRVLANRTSSP